jgi:peptidoglycan/xylan/chitin deacetylase (PgdA/CDA1 family)
LTFDDGPHPEYTPRLLDVLAKHKLTATFYVIGCEADRHRQLIRRIVDEGHELGNHTWSHSEPRLTSAEEFLDEVRRTDELLADLTGLRPTSTRPPKGELGWRKLRGLWQMNKCVALWSVDARDYRMVSSDDMVAWSSTCELHDGDIILMHDNHPWAIPGIATLASRGVFDQFETVRVSTWAGIEQRQPNEIPIKVEGAKS